MASGAYIYISNQSLPVFVSKWDSDWVLNAFNSWFVLVCSISGYLYFDGLFLPMEKLYCIFVFSLKNLVSLTKHWILRLSELDEDISYSAEEFVHSHRSAENRGKVIFESLAFEQSVSKKLYWVVFSVRWLFLVILTPSLIRLLSIFFLN